MFKSQWEHQKKVRNNMKRLRSKAGTDDIFDIVDQWFEAHKAYVDNLEQQLQNMLNRSSAISKRQKEMMQMWTEFAQTAALIAA